MRCVIISGSPDTNSDFLSEVIKPDDYVICADRGCDFAKQAGITPNLVVGDFDSEPNVLFPNTKTVRLIPERMTPTLCILSAWRLKRILIR